MLQIGNKVMVFDGGFGSEIERRSLPALIPEDLNFTHADEVQNIHRAYACADIVTTNTFGLNCVKYRGKYRLKELAEKAVENARAAGKFVFFDLGPTGAMLEPVGTLTFDAAYRAFAEMVEYTKDIVDGYIAETFSDLYELKACVLAVKEHSKKPVIATMTFDKTARTLTGSTPEIVAETLSGLGVDALGVNCSLGPKELLPIVERLLSACDTPIAVQPNCGLPVYENGKTVYRLGIEEYETYIGKFVEMGVAIVGGCCGTTPEFIKAIAKHSGKTVAKRTSPDWTAVTSATKLVKIENVKICGERLNPTGKRKLKDAIIAGDIDYLIKEAIAQEEAGADLLDLNVGIPTIDEEETMKLACRKVQEYVSLPLQIDSSDYGAIEVGARYYNGIPLINSVNGEQEVMDRIFPIAKKYGAVVLGLTMDGRGVPRTAEERFEIARRIVERAEEYGIPRRKIMIDTLVLTASAEQSLVMETVKALSLVRDRLGVKTALGVSNVSFGLPNRGLLNKTFLSMAMTGGLNMPILNPLDAEMMGAVRAFQVLSGTDENAESYIEYYRDFAPQTVQTVQRAAEKQSHTAVDLYDCIKRGLKGETQSMTESELGAKEPMSIINDVLIAALEEVGREYESGKLFLPQLISSAEAAKIAFGVIQNAFPRRTVSKGKIVLATVKGDVHDIGKNIVKVVLESYGFETVDLGKDVPPKNVLDAVRAHKPIAVGLSALMTTTVGGMEETVKLIKEEKVPVIVGGAVLTEEIAKKIGADYYAATALDTVKIAERLVKRNPPV